MSNELRSLPEKGVLFLGGHQNMTKKLRKRFPKWSFVTDDQFKRVPVINETTVFYWTGHSSHKLMRNIYSKLPDGACILYVTATNLPLLIAEMESAYQAVINYQNKQKLKGTRSKISGPASGAVRCL